MCHPKHRETKYRIAAKATQRKIIAKARHTFEARPVTAPLYNIFVRDDHEVNQTFTAAQDHMVGDSHTEFYAITFLFVDNTVVFKDSHIPVASFDRNIVPACR